VKPLGKVGGTLGELRALRCRSLRLTPNHLQGSKSALFKAVAKVRFQALSRRCFEDRRMRRIAPIRTLLVETGNSRGRTRLGRGGRRCDPVLASDEASYVTGALPFVDGRVRVSEVRRGASDRHWPAPRGLRHSPRRRRATRSLLLHIATTAYEGHSALDCCTGLPWRSMLTPTRTAGTAQTIQLAL
jgi:hypothetical protein